MSNFYYDPKHKAIAVLVSYGYGAGWGSWAYDHPEIAWDKRVVEAYLKWAFEAPHDEQERLEEDEDGGDWYDVLLGYLKAALKEMGIDEDDVYMGGAGDLEIEWVPIGSLFQIHEYDGAESLVIFNEKDWTRAE